MNAKTLLLFLLCAFSVAGVCKTTDPPPGAEEILLRGSLDVTPGSNGVEAYVYQNTVYVYFHQNFGNVNITLYEPNGSMIYNDIVNTAVQQLVVIPITSQAEGIYTIVLENPSGYFDGDFEK